MSRIGISYSPASGVGPYNFVFDNFSDTALPRAYASNSSFSVSANGASISEGPSIRQKFIWTISSTVTKANSVEIDKMFRSWDEDRATGKAAALGLTDDTFGDRVEAIVVFSTPPNFVRLSPALVLVTFGLSEV